MDKLLQFEKIVGNIVTSALKENNKELNEQISESVTKEIDYLMRLREGKRKTDTEDWMRLSARTRTRALNVLWLQRSPRM